MDSISGNTFGISLDNSRNSNLCSNNCVKKYAAKSFTAEKAFWNVKNYKKRSIMRMEKRTIEELNLLDDFLFQETI